MITEATIRTKLATDQNWLQRAILALYDYQTQDEKQIGDTRHENDCGFNSADARRMSYYARWIQSGRSLSGKFLADAQQRVQKYAKQLHRIAKEREAAKALAARVA